MLIEEDLELEVEETEEFDLTPTGLVCQGGCGGCLNCSSSRTCGKPPNCI
ncbi:hypothetical protein [Plantactinospora mayteni]|nr:hypothetical protein [Plantactinospora mayteni]